MDGSGFRPIPNFDSSYGVLGWTADGTSLYAISNRLGERLAKVYRVNVTTGKMDLWKAFGDSLPSGATAGAPNISSNGASYSYVYEQILSQAYVVKGLK